MWSYCSPTTSSTQDRGAQAPLSQFHNLHSGEVCLLVGNGPNLSKTPPEKFTCPTIGMNSIVLNDSGWKPTYYVAVDSRVMREFGDLVNSTYHDIPKFLPSPNLDKWTGENIYRFHHRPGALWPRNQERLWPSGLLEERGITYGNVMHVVMQIAYYMGFSTMLIVGMEHRPGHAIDHFWGPDHRMNGLIPVDDWIQGYKILREGMGVTMLNLSPGTYVPEDVIPRDNWEKWIDNGEEKSSQERIDR